MAFCQACGNPVSPDAKFCNVCGNAANIKVPQNQVRSDPPNPEPIANPPWPPPMQQPPAQWNARMPPAPAGFASAPPVGVSPPTLPRPAGVTVLSIFSFIGAVATFALGLIFFASGAWVSTVGSSPLAKLLIFLIPSLGAGEQDFIQQTSTTGLIFILIAAACGTMGYSLWRTLPWGRILTITLFSLDIFREGFTLFTPERAYIGSFIVIAICIWIIIYMMKPHVKQAFRA